MVRASAHGERSLAYHRESDKNLFVVRHLPLLLNSSITTWRIMIMPTMLPKKSPTYSPHCLDSGGKKKKLKGKLKSAVSLKTSHAEVGRPSLMFSAYVLSQERH